MTPEWSNHGIGRTEIPRIDLQFCPSRKGQTQGDTQLRPQRFAIEEFLHIVRPLLAQTRDRPHGGDTW
jgi:hypothetical protein